MMFLRLVPGSMYLQKIPDAGQAAVINNNNTQMTGSKLYLSEKIFRGIYDRQVLFLFRNQSEEAFGILP